jgi:glycosidase
VQALHAAGIEVILDVVLNHTGEGDALGPTLSFRGLDNAAYYRTVAGDRARYVNDAGCGNVLALERPFPLRLALDALRHYALAANVDGFRFDLATTLARRYQLPRPRDIRWADDMVTRWGSCTTTTGHIRISTRLAAFPDWVIDYVIVHELAHLEVAGHGPDFWRLAHRYPKAERAIGYLIAKAADGDDTDGGAPNL